MRLWALVMSFAAGSAFAGVTWFADFETQDLSQWDSFVVHPERWTFVTSMPTPTEGQYAARVELDEMDYGPSNLIRTEVGHTPATLADFQDTDRWYGWSTMSSVDFPLGAFDHQLMFWECDAPIYQQEMSLHVSGTAVSFATSPQGGQYQTRWNGTFAAGVWHRFVLHVKWSLDATVGFVELWFDGTQVVPKFSMRTMHAVQDSMGNDTTPLTSTMHHGLFLGNYRAGKPVEVVYLDDVIEGTAESDVHPVADGGVTLDAGIPDAGVTNDAGSISDAGDLDAGAPDAGVTFDSGEPDSGVFDDGGVTPPARGSASPIYGTCGCGAADSTTLLALALASLMMLRRSPAAKA